MSNPVRILDLDVPRGIALMLMMVAPSLSDGGRAYAELAEQVQAFLAGHGRAGQWGALDIDAFLRSRQRSRRERVDACCNLSAMLPWLLQDDALSASEARRLWQDLRRLCPDDAAAHRYIELGLREFAEAATN